MSDLQSVGSKALQKAPKPLQRALDGINVQFRGENGPTQALANGLQSGNIAGVQERDPNTINVMDRQSFQKAPEQLVTHEGMHLWQNNLPPAIQKAIPQDNPQDPYNFGGDAGVKRVLDNGKGLANMPREQAAAAMQYGQSQGMPPLYQKLANTINDVPLSQIEMTEPNAKTLNTHPRPPQVPAGMNFANTIYVPGQSPDGLVTQDMLPNAMPAAATAQPLARNPLQQNIANDQQQLQKVQWAQQNPWGTANNHPGTLGKIAHVLSVAGNIAGDIVAPNVMARVPGTELHNEVEGNQLQGRLNQEQQEESQNEARGAQTAHAQEETAEMPQNAQTDQALKQAQTAHLGAETDAIQHPTPQYEYQQTDHGLLAIDKKTGQAQPVTLNGQPIGPKVQTKVAQLEVGGKPHSELVNESTGEVIKDLGETGEKPPQVSINQGTWSLAEDAQGHPELFNSKTGETKAAPAGMQKTGTFAKAQSANAGANQALGYATDYLNKRAFTGPGDEALQEKFFELAKPSTGFRMSQPQIDMLRNSASWMNSLEGRAHHAMTGTWFSDQQRQQIVNTMQQLAQAKGLTMQNAQGGEQGGSTGGEAPEGFKVRMPDGSIQVKQGGKWVKQ